MFRTQLYLTDGEKTGLAALSETTGKSQSQLIREAVDRLLIQFAEMKAKEALKRAAGMWKERTDLPDFEALRREWDRNRT